MTNFEQSDQLESIRGNISRGIELTNQYWLNKMTEGPMKRSFGWAVEDLNL